MVGAPCEGLHADTLIARMCKYTPGGVTFEEFAFEMQKATEKQGAINSKKLAKNVWFLFDQGQTGRVTPEHVQATMHQLKPEYDCSPIVRLIKSLDLHNKGYIEQHQFASFVDDVERRMHSEA